MSKYQTEQRKKLVTLFENSPHQTLSAQDIAVALNDQSISISAIYRNLAEMVEDGLLCKVSEKNRSGSLYQYMDPNHCAGIVHFKCDSCNATYHLDRNISQMIMGIAQDSFSFEINGTAAFLYGKCSKCSHKNNE